MNTTIIFAQILGIVFTVVGLSMLLSTTGTIALVEETIENKGLLWLWGFIALLVGAIVIGFNNLWNPGLQLFVTLIGWAALLKGIVILVFPKSTILFYKKLNKKSLFISTGCVALIIGLLLLLW